MPYSIHEHKHRFSAWAAGRATTVKGCRFSVEQARMILESSRLKQLLLDPGQLPDPPNMDFAHREWRATVIAAAMAEGLEFTHGVSLTRHDDNAGVFGSVFQVQFVKPTEV